MKQLSLATLVLAGLLAPASLAQRSVPERPTPQRPAPERPAPERPAPERPAPEATPKPGVAGHDLSTARSVFGHSDADGDGVISAAEAAGAGVGRQEYAGFDADGSGGVTSDEFLVGYRKLLARHKQKVAPDLDAEATRLQALRRAREARGGGEGGATDGPSTARLRLADQEDTSSVEDAKTSVSRERIKNKAQEDAQFAERLRKAAGTGGQPVSPESSSGVRERSVQGADAGSTGGPSPIRLKAAAQDDAGLAERLRNAVDVGSQPVPLDGAASARRRFEQAKGDSSTKGSPAVPSLDRLKSAAQDNSELSERLRNALGDQNDSADAVRPASGPATRRVGSRPGQPSPERSGLRPAPTAPPRANGPGKGKQRPRSGSQGRASGGGSSSQGARPAPQRPAPRVSPPVKKGGGGRPGGRD